MHKFGNTKDFPACITVFSAPNYCGTYANRGAVITLFDNNLKLKTYTQEKNSFHLPVGYDLFSWSFPFVADKCVKMLQHILTRCSDRALMQADYRKDAKAATEMLEE
jgi:serine/threonine-protein phosphatase 2B catalytic subunit